MPGKILIADDEPHIRKLIELSLKRGGYQILVACNGGEALEMAAKEQPSLIVMDVNMPEMDGLTALKHLKSAPGTAGIPVIMLTARSQTMTQSKAEELGAVAYLTKPFSPTQLLAEAQRIIASSSPAPNQDQ